MTAYVIKLVGTADTLWPMHGHRYVATVDHSREPEDSVTLTPHIHHAKMFPDRVAALEAWKGVNERVPVRPDGEPNRPLTAYAVEILPVEAP